MFDLKQVQLKIIITNYGIVSSSLPSFTTKRKVKLEKMKMKPMSIASECCRYSMNPHGSATPESIALKHSTYLRPDVHHPKVFNNGAGVDRGSRSPSW